MAEPIQTPPHGIVVVQGVTKFTPEVHRAIQSASDDFDVIRNADLVIGIHGNEATILKHREGSTEHPIAMVDLREKAKVYREDGEHLIVKIGQEPNEGDVRTVSGIPIRGVTRVTVEDDMNAGRAVILRLRETDVEFPLTLGVDEAGGD